MKTMLSALGAAALAVSFAAGAIAQTAPNPSTKVYAYQKRAQQAKNNAAGGTATAVRTGEQIPNTSTHGTPQWWEVLGRSNSAGGGSD